MLYSLEVVCHLGKKESCDRKFDESVRYAYTYDNRIGLPILVHRRVLNDLNHAKRQKLRGLLDIGFFRLFPLNDLRSHLEVLDFDIVVYDK